MISSMFPQTMRLLHESAPFVDIPHVMLSILRPGKSIPPHRGYFRGILRYHLALSIPPHSTEDLHLRVYTDEEQGKYEMVTWSNGSDVIFDDVNLHEVINNVNETRILLFIDFARPDLPLWKRAFNKLMLMLIGRANTCNDGMDIQEAMLMDTCNVQDDDLWRGIPYLESPMRFVLMSMLIVMNTAILFQICKMST